MTRTKAIQIARKLAKRAKETNYVVYEDGEYYACNDIDLDTFYQGITPDAAIEPDGQVYA